MLILKNSSNLCAKHKKIEDLQKSTGCHNNCFVNDKIKDIPECTLYCVISQININSDQILMLFSPFMIKLNTTWGCQLPPGCNMLKQCSVLLAHTCIFWITFQSLNVTLLELEASGTLMLVLALTYLFCSQFQLVPRHVDYQWHSQQHVIALRRAKCDITLIFSVLLAIDFYNE